VPRGQHVEAVVQQTRRVTGPLDAGAEDRCCHAHVGVEAGDEDVADVVSTHVCQQPGAGQHAVGGRDDQLAVATGDGVFKVADQLASFGRCCFAADIDGQVFEAPIAEVGARVRQQVLDVVLDCCRYPLTVAEQLGLKAK
jgi:hypothetical protein